MVPRRTEACLGDVWRRHGLVLDQGGVIRQVVHRQGSVYLKTAHSCHPNRWVNRSDRVRSLDQTTSYTPPIAYARAANRWRLLAMDARLGEVAVQPIGRAVRDASSSPGTSTAESYRCSINRSAYSISRLGVTYRVSPYRR